MTCIAYVLYDIGIKCEVTQLSSSLRINMQIDSVVTRSQSLGTADEYTGR